MRRVWLKLSLVMLAVALLASLATYLLANTRLNLEVNTEQGLSVDTRFPNTTCRKTLMATFPFVTFTCESETPAGGTTELTPDAASQENTDDTVKP